MMLFLLIPTPRFPWKLTFYIADRHFETMYIFINEFFKMHFFYESLFRKTLFGDVP